VNTLAEALKYFFWLAVCVWDVMVHFWPISLAVFVAALASLVVASPFRNPHFRRVLPFLVVPYGIPIIILAFGTVFAYDLHGPHLEWREPPAWQGYVLWGLIGLHLATLVAAPLILKGARLRSAGVLLPGVWMSLCVLLPAASSISGVWP